MSGKTIRKSDYLNDSTKQPVLGKIEIVVNSISFFRIHSFVYLHLKFANYTNYTTNNLSLLTIDPVQIRYVCSVEYCFLIQSFTLRLIGSLHYFLLQRLQSVFKSSISFLLTFLSTNWEWSLDLMDKVWRCINKLLVCCLCCHPCLSTWILPLILISNDDEVISLHLFSRKGDEGRKWREWSAPEKYCCSANYVFFHIVLVPCSSFVAKSYKFIKHTN